MQQSHIRNLIPVWFDRAESFCGKVGRVLRSGLFRRTAVFTFSSSLNALTNFLLLPVLTRYLSPADYGIIETFLSVLAALVGIMLLGSSTTLSKEFFSFQPQQRAAYLGSAVALSVSVGTILAISVLVLGTAGEHVARWLKVESAILLAAVVVASARAIVATTQTVFQLEKRTGTYAGFVNGNTLTEIALSLGLVVLVGLQWQGRIAGIVITQVGAMIAAIWWLRRNQLLTFSGLGYIGQILKNAPPLVLAHIAGWGVTMADRLIVCALVDAEGVGLYGVGSRFAMVVMMVGTSFSLAWLPFFYENIQKGDAKSNITIVRTTYLAVLLLVGIGLACGVGARWLIYLMVDQRFYPASDFVLLMSMAYCADGIWKLFTGYLIHRGKLGMYSIILCAAASLNVLLDYALIPSFGPIGAAWAALCALSFGMVFTIVAAIQIHPMPWLYFLKRGGAIA